MKNQRGSVTVMLLLVLSCILIAVMVVVEAGRLRMAKEQAQRAVDQAAFSALASYDQDLKDGYGLFYRYEDGTLAEEVRENLERTLLISDAGSAWRPYDYRIEELAVAGRYPLTDRNSLKHQILEHMKYRGPAILVGEVTEKLGMFLTMQGTARAMKADLAADRQVMKFAACLQELETDLEAVNRFTDSQLSYLDGYGAKAAEKAYQVVLTERQIARLDPLEDAEEISRLQASAETTRYEVAETVRWILGDLEPVLTANRKALTCIETLIRLRPQAEEAIRKAETTLNEEEHTVTEVDEALREKYEQYKAYLNAEGLENAADRLRRNIRLLEDRVTALRNLTSGQVYGPRPSVFDNAGYRPVDFKAPDFPAQPGSTGTGGSIGPDLVAKLAKKAAAYLESMKASVVVSDKGPVLQCPGNGSATASAGMAMAGDDFETAGEDLDSVYGTIGERIDSAEVLDSIVSGALDIPQEAFESLLINEYVLTTFNNRSDGGRDKHALEETEVEYILIGDRRPQVNASCTQLEILAWRTAFNAVSFGYYCPEIARSIEGASVTLNGITGVPFPVWKGVLTGLLAFLDGYADTKRLVEGETVLLFKFRLADTSLARELEDLLGGTAEGTPESGGAKSAPRNAEVDYEDHLRAMLLYRSLGGGEAQILDRVQDLIYMNLSSVREAYNPEQHIGCIEADAAFSIKSLFQALGRLGTDLPDLPGRPRLHVAGARGY